jgi:hypothetical protein
MVQNEEMDFETSHVNKDGKHNQASDTCDPVSKVGSL